MLLYKIAALTIYRESRAREHFTCLVDAGPRLPYDYL